ncbi:DNA topoisomerase II large subunit [Shewanella phage Thanatos-2]|nr:DNA topoisomerase II large subunit [Shewanella phage Thanatos-2]
MIENKIVALSDKEHILKRPDMFIGSVVKETHDRFLFGKWTQVEYVPGLIKIYDEILDNSVDEAIRTNFKFANKISVVIDGPKITVTDNGRGIPQDDVVMPDGSILPGPFAAWTSTKTGGNFGDDSERKTGGKNGVGSSLTNIFSSLFIGITCDGTTELTVNCSNGTDNKSWSKKPGKVKGTSVSFIPEFEYFGVNGLSATELDIILDRLETLAVVYPKIEFKFNGKVVKGVFKTFAKRFDEEALIHDSDNFSVAIGRSEEGFRQLTYVNNINTRLGGHHIDFFMDEFGNHLMGMIKSKYKIEVTKARIRECLTMVMFIRDMSNLRFDSQTKERFTSTYGDIKSHINVDFKKLAQQFMKNETVLMPIIELALARKEAADKAAEARAAKKVVKAKVVKHVKANKIGTNAETTLFLTEGDSAIGYLLSTRDQDTQGGFPLRGKFMNTWKMPYKKMLENREVFDILAITGLTLGDPDISNMSYKNIAIMVDADVDGTGSIFPSLLAFFSNWPELFHQNRIQFIRTPILILSKGNKTEWIYSQEEYESVKDKYESWDKRYIKGLGSLDVDEYERIIRQPVIDTIKLPENWEDLFELIMGEESAPRKEWMAS